LVVGINTVTDLFLRSVAEFAAGRLKVVGIVGRTVRHTGRFMQQYRILGVPDDIDGILKTLEVHGITVNRIVITTPFDALSPAAQEALLTIEKTSDTQLDFFAERLGFAERSEGCLTSAQTQNRKEEPLAFKIAEIETEMPRAYWRRKRVFDLTIAAIFVVLAMPLILIVGLVVALDVGLPTVFWQQRPGLRGRPFKLYKFRTMRSAHDSSGVRIPDAQRLSSIGRFLRRTRLDELPQLYNILIGEMSFVGPRPLLHAEQAACAARLLGPPGLTGWAQINGGREVATRDKAALDIYYLRHASLWLDIIILGRTFSTLLGGERAHVEAVGQAWRELADAPYLAAGELVAAARPAQTLAANDFARRPHAA
jgi:lipopolysaccharide/colanic/teichoic acid biosynthesis glycosyltransferase